MLTLPQDIAGGYWDSRKFHSGEFSPVRTSVKFEVEYFPEDGRSTFLDGKEIPIRADHIFIAKPGQKRYSRLHFSALYLRFSAQEDLARQLEACTGSFAVTHGERIRESLEELLWLLETGKERNFLSAGKFLLLMDTILQEANRTQPSNPLHAQLIFRAKHFIRENYARSLRLSDIAAAVNLSPTYFHRIFSEEQHLSPHDYLLECRIANAKKMLWNPAIDITTVAEACGFGCQQYLNKIFKQQTGQTPGEYRRSAQQNYLEAK